MLVILVLPMEKLNHAEAMNTSFSRIWIELSLRSGPILENEEKLTNEITFITFLVSQVVHLLI